jgi:hypothetical protein
MDLNKIIKKVVKESVVRKKLTEVKSTSDEFYILTTVTGGVIMIPKSSNPEINTVVNKSKFKSALSTPEQIYNYASKSPLVTEACNAIYKDMDLDECYSLYVQSMFNKWVDGGIMRFTANVPLTGKRESFKSCWKKTDGGKFLKFENIIFSGYYPSSDNSRNCKGNPWSIKVSDTEEVEDKDFSSNIKFEIKLPMIK